MLPFLVFSLSQLLSSSVISNYFQIYPNHHLCIEMNRLLFSTMQASAAVIPKSGVFLESKMQKDAKIVPPVLFLLLLSSVAGHLLLWQDNLMLAVDVFK